MGDALKTGSRRSAHALGWGAGVDQLWMGRLQREQAIEERIVFAVANRWRIQHVIGVVVLCKALTQGLGFPAHGLRGRGTAFCAPPCGHRGLGRDIWRRWNSRMRWRQ